MSAQIFHRQVWPLRDRLYRLAYRLLGQQTEAEDVVQETMIKLWERRAELADIKNIEGWCIRLVRNHGIDRYRSRDRRSTSDLEKAPEPASTEPTPVRRLQQVELREKIDRLIQALPEQRRLVIQLREIEGRSYQEIADTLDISLDQVRTDLHRARRSLRTSLVKNPCHE